MEFLTYNPDHYELLLQKREDPRFPSALGHRAFVNWYYASGHCRLHLFVDHGELAGIIGLDIMDFVYDGQPMRMAAANNHVAFLPGIGGLQFLYWMKAAPHALVFGGSEDTHEVMRKNGWRYFPPVPLLLANRRFGNPAGEPAWRSLAKRALGGLLPSVRLAARREAILRRQACPDLTAREESGFREGMLPATSPFRFRFAPTLAYLRWRYATDLPFVRYRLFGIRDGNVDIGYVVLKETPERIWVSQCDGTDASLLACGVLLALAEVTRDDPRPRELCLYTAHEAMRALFLRFGFIDWRLTRPLVIGGLRQPAAMEDDTRQWLVNFDWNDNGLRRPFLDE
ncbi:MAG: hypothetical protein HQM03_19525 [Magnetococcales bacterium]|nr:hypothetical protein [Magnetococcales bacterium]